MNEKLSFEKISIHKGPKQSPGFLLWRLSTSWRTSVEAILKTFGLTHPQFVVLATTGWLTRNGKPVTQVAIGKMAGLDPNTNSQILKGLEQKELIQRTQSTDGRAKNISLTQKGTEILKLALPAVEQTDTKFFSFLKENETAFLIEIFQTLMPEPLTE
jgi:DNA-binding MarR family transcriptional regulator